MDIHRFITELPDHYPDFLYPLEFARSDYHIDDSDFPAGPVTEYIGHMLNFAVSLLASGEAYLQLGSDSLAALGYAMTGNLDKYYYLIAHFSIADMWETHLNAWIKRRPEYASLLKVIKRDFFRNLQTEPLPLAHKIGVCFYNSFTSYKILYKTLKWLEPYLAEQALVIVADANWEDVRDAVKDWTIDDTGAFLIFDLPTPTNSFPTWWNGILVLGHSKPG
ncbi:MAG: hypothetical protein ACM3WV_10345 [Bacillota bacterium]